MANFEGYKIFYHVACCSNITQAAQKLYMTQPAVTKAIQRLEEELKVTLFIRGHKGVELTIEGKHIFDMIAPACEELFKAEARMLRNLAVEVGHARISTNYYVANTYLVDFMGVFKEQYPNVTFEIDCDPPEVKKARIWDNHGDIFVDYEQALFEDGDVRKDRLMVTEVDTLNYGVYVGEPLKYLTERPMSLSELTEQTLILPGSDGVSYSMFNELCARFGRENKILCVSGSQMRWQLAEQGRGVLIRTERQSGDLLEEFNLYPVVLQEELPKRKLLLCTQPKNELTIAARTVCDMLIQFFAERTE